jgi:SAM-dependent methyltransferase
MLPPKVGIMQRMTEYAALRRKSFRKRLPFNEELRKVAGSETSHWFLANPASQNTYLYQVEFIREFSERHFRAPFSKLAILDWGCGKGHVSFLLRQRGAKLKACDYRSDGAPDPDSTFGQATPITRSAGIPVDPLEDAIRLPYENASFDVVLSVGVLEHVANDLESLKEIHRVLRPGGLLFCFNLPYFLSWTQRLAHLRGNFYHDRLYSKALAKRLLRRSGYDLLHIWHRQLLPKNTVRYPCYRFFENLDQILVDFSPLRYLATNIEFVAATPNHSQPSFHENAYLRVSPPERLTAKP